MRNVMKFPMLHCVICLILMKAVSVLTVPLHGCVRYTNHLFAVKLKCFQTLKKALKKFLNWPIILSQKKFAHLLVPSDAPAAAEEVNDDGVDVKDPAQRAATVESVSASDFKAVAAAQGAEGSKEVTGNGCDKF